jgi:hypothetical protein
LFCVFLSVLLLKVSIMGYSVLFDLKSENVTKKIRKCNDWIGESFPLLLLLLLLLFIISIIIIMSFLGFNFKWLQKRMNVYMDSACIYVLIIGIWLPIHLQVMWNSRVSRVILLSDSNVEWRLRIIEGAYWFVFWCFTLSAISHWLLMLRGALINIEWGLYHGADIWFFVFQELVDEDNIRIWWLQKHFLIPSMSKDVLLKIAKFLWNCLL